MAQTTKKDLALRKSFTAKAIILAGVLHAGYGLMNHVTGPDAVQDVRFAGEGELYRHYDYGTRSVYRELERGRGFGSITLIDEDNDGMPDYKRIVYPSKTQYVDTKIDKDPEYWHVEQTYRIDERYW